MNELKDTSSADRPARLARGRETPATLLLAILLPLSCGLAGGFLDLALIVFRKFFWNGLKNYENARDFPWSVPVGHVVLLIFPVLFLAIVNRLRPRPIALGTSAWFFATLAIWFALLRMPLYGAATLILAVGAGRQIGGKLAAHFLRPRRAWFTLSALLCLLLVLAAVSSGRHAARQSRILARLPAPPSNARNVIMVVWDAVRATNLGVYGHPRNTTPNLAFWCRRGVRYSMALAPAPWTYPSHASFFTGRWPFQLISQWKYTLDAPVPTLAEHLTKQGYLTAGFSANTLVCTYETRLDRGFTHFDDYAYSPWSLLTRTVPGSWFLESILYRGNFFAAKWIRLQSRSAGDINKAFLDWLGRRRQDRPFFAYLNYFDGHEPYIPPAGFAGRFGIRPQAPRDYEFLLDYGNPGWKTIPNRDIAPCATATTTASRFSTNNSVNS